VTDDFGSETSVICRIDLRLSLKTDLLRSTID
jgi:hypothetical protein